MDLIILFDADEVYVLKHLTFPALESLRLSCTSGDYEYMKENDVAQATSEGAIVGLLNKYAGKFNSFYNKAPQIFRILNFTQFYADFRIKI